MSKLELISIIVGISTSIIGLIVSFIALFISSKNYWRKNKINHTIINAWNFINIYQYLTSVIPNHYDNKWKQENQIFWLIYNQKIFQDSIIHIFPNIKNINYFKSLNFNDEKIFFDILNKSLFKLDETLNNANLKQINIACRYWKNLFKKINKIQKWLIDDLKIIHLHITNEKYNLEFIKKNEYKEFWIELYFDVNNNLINSFQKTKDNKKNKKIIKQITKIKNKGLVININKYKKIKTLLNKKIPKLKFLILKSNLFLLHYVTKNDAKIDEFYDRTNKLNFYNEENS